jgi:hypothetical protein
VKYINMIILLAVIGKLCPVLLENHWTEIEQSDSMPKTYQTEDAMVPNMKKLTSRAFSLLALGTGAASLTDVGAVDGKKTAKDILNWPDARVKGMGKP